MASRPSTIDRIINFLHSYTTIKAVKVPKIQWTEQVWQGVTLRSGIICYDSRAIGDGILHEAGHLASLPKDLRPWADGFLGPRLKEQYIERYIEWHQLKPMESQNASRALIQLPFGSEAIAEYWCYCASKFIGLPSYYCFQRGYGRSPWGIGHSGYETWLALKAFGPNNIMVDHLKKLEFSTKASLLATWETPWSMDAIDLTKGPEARHLSRKGL